MNAVRVVLPCCRALRQFILSGERTLNALPDPDGVDPLSGALIIVVALTLGGVIVTACAITYGLLCVVDDAKNGVRVAFPPFRDSNGLAATALGAGCCSGGRRTVISA